MSMIACQECTRFIDSDIDPDCFVGEQVLCDVCRERRCLEDENKPIYVRQNGDLKNDREVSAWLQAAGREATAKGCTWLRYSVHPVHTHLALVEGWEVRPEDEGEQRWALTAIT